MAECGFAELGCYAGEALGGVTDEIEADTKTGVEAVVEAVFAGWLKLPVMPIGEDFGATGFLRDNLLWLAALFTGMSLVVFAFTLVFRPTKDTVRGGAGFLLRVLAVTGGGVLITSMLISVSDGFALWFLDRATAGDGLATTILNTFQITGPTGFLLAIGFALVAIGLSFLQGLLLIARNVMLPFLVGVSPVAVALSYTEMGKNWWTKYLSWFIAFLLYKPTAALIYGTGFWLLAEGDIFGSLSLGELALSVMNFMYGGALLLMSLVSFFALAGAITPVVGKLTGGTGGAALIGLAGASALASGVIGRPTNVKAPRAPTSVTPNNPAAGGPAATGVRGTASTMGKAASTAGGPVATGVKLAAQGANNARNSFNRSLNNENEER